ncbi:bifunctional Doublecortin domain superfamily/Doublecortin domain [Babesia duncani]|uniref:Bifunctional Doublecortin domain superfamily/Doublecortin domain n=1 Tax=Babesia duncani TaxID=323732 RepID=A0AAD9PPF6_9APIC|nr:bifunctional Doublecortin domain superfamily/Doublecortin domain [Babesia duncani]
METFGPLASDYGYDSAESDEDLPLTEIDFTQPNVHLKQRVAAFCNVNAGAFNPDVCHFTQDGDILGEPRVENDLLVPYLTPPCPQTVDPVYENEVKVPMASKTQVSSTPAMKCSSGPIGMAPMPIDASAQWLSHELSIADWYYQQVQSGDACGNFETRDVFERLTDANFYTGIHRHPKPLGKIDKRFKLSPGTLGVQRFGVQITPPKLMWIYRNGDKFHKGTAMYLKPCIRSMSQVYQIASKTLELYAGPVRRIYDQELNVVRNIREIVNGGKYLLTSGEGPANLDRLGNFLSEWVIQDLN